MLHVAQPIGHHTGHGFALPNAKQSVNRKIILRRWFSSEGHTSLTCSLQRQQGIGGAVGFVPQPSHHRVAPPQFQMQGRFQAVAAVVARAASQPNRLRVRGDGTGQLCHGQTSALHQGVRVKLRRCSLLDTSRGGYAVQRVAGRAMEAKERHGQLILTLCREFWRVLQG